MALQTKFKGCMVGALIGDCLGEPYEYKGKTIDQAQLQTFLNSKIENDEENATIMDYTDDTAMTNSVARSLIENKGFNAKDMARKFAEEYANDKKVEKRSYGKNVRETLRSLLTSEDVFEPAKHQFNGTGSRGNGGAMRVAPVALFTFKKDAKETAELAKQSALLTHFNVLGYNGAILQSLAVKEALRFGYENLPLVPNEFIDTLINQMKEIEDDEPKIYTERLDLVKKLLEDPKATTKLIVAKLGNNVSAHKSVPTAIYAFLRSLEPIPFYETTNPFVRTIFLAISFGGDTDTIACMAGAIAGAYYGIEIIPESLPKICEGIKTTLKLADDLTKIVEE